MDHPGEMAATTIVAALKSVAKYAIVGYITKQALLAVGKVK